MKNTQSFNIDIRQHITKTFFPSIFKHLSLNALIYGYSKVNTARILQCLPAGSDWSLLCNDASYFLLVSGLETQLELEWKYVLLEKNCHTH